MRIDHDMHVPLTNGAWRLTQPSQYDMITVLLRMCIVLVLTTVRTFILNYTVMFGAYITLHASRRQVQYLGVDRTPPQTQRLLPRPPPHA